LSAPRLPAAKVRELLEAHRAGEAARAELAAALDPHAVYSEDADPAPVILVVKGELVELKPVHLYSGQAPDPHPEPAPEPGPGPEAEAAVPPWRPR
jgi:hypothetical protein